MGWKTGERLAGSWYSLSLRKKMYILVAALGLIVGASIFLNLKVLYYFTDTFNAVMSDNLSCHRFQEALSEETEAFAAAIDDRSPEHLEKYEEACSNTAGLLNQLPYDYGKIGENRYAITWNIRNSYGAYEKKRDEVFSMRAGKPEYVYQLYEVYDMQDYLAAYASRLTQAVLLEGNAYYEEQLPKLTGLPFVLGAIGVAVFLALLFSMGFLTKGMVATMGQLAAVSRSIEKNDFSAADVTWKGEDEMGQLVKAFNKMKRAMEDYVRTSEEKSRMEIQLHRQQMEQAQLEQRFSMAQLELLKSQMNPHFLFNTLNMITRMSQMEEAPVTEEMLVAMSNLLRYSLRTAEPLAPLKEELKVVQDYMYIQQMRFGERIRWKVICPQELYGREVPVFLLQPLVENAVIHGISCREEGGSISICVEEKDGIMRICIEDTGAGMSQERLKQIRGAMANRGSGLGIGLGNIYRRITTYYEHGHVAVDSRENEGTRVEISFGARKM